MGKVVVILLNGEICGDTFVQRVQCGKVRMKRRKRFVECLSREQCVQRCVARHRVARAWWQDLPFFLQGLGAGKGGFELPRGPGHAVPGNE